MQPGCSQNFFLIQVSGLEAAAAVPSTDFCDVEASEALVGDSGPTGMAAASRALVTGSLCWAAECL